MTSVNAYAPAHSVIDMITNVWRWFTWYQVVAADRNNGYAMVWWARDEKDALDWVRTYKPRFSVAYGKRGKLLGGRRAVY